MYLAAAEKVIGAAFRSPDVRERLMNPPADTVPRAFRKYTPPVRSPRADKTLRTVHGRSRPRTGKTAAHLQYSSRLLRPRLPPARDPRRSHALARHRVVSRKGRRAPRYGAPARTSSRSGVAPFPLPSEHDRSRPGFDRRFRADQRLRSGLSYLVLPLEQHARRAALPTGRPGIAASPRKPSRFRSSGCSGIPRRERWPRTSPASGCRRASSRSSRPTRPSSLISTSR